MENDICTQKSILICSFDQKIRDTSYRFDQVCDKYHDPQGVTLGFRQVVWKCFSSIYHSELSNTTMTWLGIPFSLDNIVLFESVDTSLCETEGELFILAFVVSSEIPSGTNIARMRIKSGLNEQEAISSLLKALPTEISNNLTDCFSHTLGFPGLATFVIDKVKHSDNKTCALMFGFFYWGKLLLWRIRREQADINISLLQKNFKDAIFLTAVQRSRIINIKRFQLTSNISNDGRIKETAKAMKAILNLHEEYKNDENLNTLFEEYLASLEKLFSEESRKKVEKGVAIFSFIAVPFTIIGALVGLKADSEIIKSAITLLQNNNVIIFVTASILAPVIFYSIVSLTYKEKDTSKRLADFRKKSRASKKKDSKYLARLLKFLSPKN